MNARATRATLLLTALALGAGALALWLFPRAFPALAIENRIPRQDALRRADAFFRAHDLAPPLAHIAIRFHQADSLLTFVDLAGGGRDTLNALVRGRDVAPFTWSVRAFAARDPREARVHLSPDGRVVGFQRKLAEADARPALSPDSARSAAGRILSDWLDEPPDRWKLVTSSYETRKTSARVDRTFTFERTGRTVAAAPIRIDIVIAGDLPSLARPYVVIPESFSRRYGEMRSANDLLSSIDLFGVIAIVVAGIAGLRRYARHYELRWRAPLVAGGVIAALLMASGINDIASSWYDYDTATSPAVFETLNVASALGGGLAMGVIVALTLVAAEALARAAFPDHLDWWKLWQHRGTREVAGRVAGGYAVALFAFAYVALFYLVTRRYLGWWVPTELLDDPNQIATPLPWIGGISLSLQAGVWEEALFRAVPLSFLSLWVGTRPHRSLWMAAGVVTTALIFGFGHASYPSWPPYSRGVEIFLDACLWGALFLQFGIIVTVVAHFVYDLTLFGIFAATGTAIEYRVTAVMIVLALLAPAIAVAWQWVRQRGLASAPDDARSGAWVKEERLEPAAVGTASPARAMTARSRTVAVGIAAAGALAALISPSAPVLGPPFTADRARTITLADSLLRARGVEPARWKRLSRTAGATDTAAAWPAFLRAEKAERLAEALASTYATPAGWVVRYVRADGALAEREEEWRVRLRPNGVLFDIRHVVAEAAPGASPDPEAARRIAREAVARAGIDTTPLRETTLEETARPARRDITITYTDSATALPGGARARVWVSLAGSEPVLVRRGVELPERFLREDRDRQAARLATALVCGLLLTTLVAVGAVVVHRKRTVLADDHPAGKRAVVAIVGVLAISAAAQTLNTLPVILFAYDTAVPWATYVGSTWIGVAFSALPALVVAGLWLATNALRRRAGIPIVADAASGATGRDALTAGLALGSLLALPGFLSNFVTPAVPPGPQTLLDQAFPWLDGVLGMPMRAATIVPLIAIPALTVLGLGRRTSIRVVLGLVIIGLAAGTALPLAQRNGSVSALGVTLGGVAVIALVSAMRAWGGVCVMAWVTAAFTHRALASVHFALYAPTGIEQVSGLLGAVVSAGLIWWINSRTTDFRGGNPDSHGSRSLM